MNVNSWCWITAETKMMANVQRNELSCLKDYAVSPNLERAKQLAMNSIRKVSNYISE